MLSVFLLHLKPLFLSNYNIKYACFSIYYYIVDLPEKKRLTHLAQIKRDEARAAADLAAQEGHVHEIHLVVLPGGTIHIVQLQAPNKEPVHIVHRLTPLKGCAKCV